VQFIGALTDKFLRYSYVFIKQSVVIYMLSFIDCLIYDGTAIITAERNISELYGVCRNSPREYPILSIDILFTDISRITMPLTQRLSSERI
tara:strand:- start:201 stop:473 length:273 start_codon:yes stop_codon:yes gene_type:complete